MTDRLAQIQARANDPFGTLRDGIGQVDEDRDFLLAMVRERDAALERVRELHKPIDSGDLRIIGPVCAECSEVDDYQFTFYPCPTIAAITAMEGAE